MDNAASVMSSTKQFGHFLLPLKMNKDPVDAKIAEHEFAQAHRTFETVPAGRPELHANRNLLAMLAFRLGEYEQAFEYLDTILSVGEDPNNLNALANRKYMCEKLFRFPEARDCEQKIARLLAQDGTADGERRLRRLKGRSLAEQAFAFSHEFNHDSVTCERFRKAVEFYQKASEVAGSDVSPEELEEWKFQYGWSCHTIYDRIKRKASQEEIVLFFQEAVKSFISVVQSGLDSNRKCHSWRHLGNLFRTSRKSNLPPIPETFRGHTLEPEKCFEEALSISPDQESIYTFYARHCNMKGETRKAFSLINKSITVNDTVLNSHARYTRGCFRLEQYEQELEDFQKYPTHIPPDCTILTYAEVDFKYALQDFSRPHYLESMAKVHYYKAMNPNGEVKHGHEGRKNLQQSLTYLTKAASCADGEKRSFVHRDRGKCLCAMGEHQAALSCFKQAFECGKAISWYGEGCTFLVAEYEHILKAIPSPLPDDSPLLADMVYWLYKVADACFSIDWRLHPLAKLKSLTDHWKSFVKYCNLNGYKNELESIEAVGLHKQSAQRRAYLQHRISALEQGPSPPQSETRRHQSLPRTCSSEGAALPSGDQPTAERITAPLSAVQLSTTSAESDIRYIVYSVNTKTGEIHQVSQTPTPSPVVSSDDVTTKHFRPSTPKPFNSRLPYDFSVIHSNSASEWVQHCMLEELEGTGLKGCVKERDFPLGKPILEEYSKSIRNSVCTIIVITKDFEEDTFCGHAMLQAIQESELVIPILLESRDMPVLLKPYTCLDATGAVDWEKLKRSIEQTGL